MILKIFKDGYQYSSSFISILSVVAEIPFGDDIVIIGALVNMGIPYFLKANKVRLKFPNPSVSLLLHGRDIPLKDSNGVRGCGIYRLLLLLWL